MELLMNLYRKAQTCIMLYKKLKNLIHDLELLVHYKDVGNNHI